MPGIPSSPDQIKRSVVKADGNLKASVTTYADDAIKPNWLIAGTSPNIYVARSVSDGWTRGANFQWINWQGPTAIATPTLGVGPVESGTSYKIRFIVSEWDQRSGTTPKLAVLVGSTVESLTITEADAGTLKATTAVAGSDNDELRFVVTSGNDDTLRHVRLTSITINKL